MRLRALRDANKESINESQNGSEILQVASTNSHYLWKPESTKYRSNFFPSRQADPNRDDLALRAWVKPPMTSRRPPPHPNHRSRSLPRHKKVDNRPQ